VKRATDVFAVVIALAGFVVSYSTQVTLASQHGFPGWEAWLWPGIADTAALAMVLRLQVGAVRSGFYTVEAWGVFALASAVMVGANAIADRTDPLGGAMHAVVPIVGMLVWHVVIHGRPAEGSGQGSTARGAAEAGGKRSPRTRTRRTATARIEQLLQQDPAPSTGEIVQKLRVSEGLVRRVRRGLRLESAA
jgi:Protein of unknown function (DUF2637)